MPAAFFLCLTGEKGKESLFRRISGVKELLWMRTVLRPERRSTRRPGPTASQEENSVGS